jgi:hypothetical protein
MFVRLVPLLTPLARLFFVANLCKFSQLPFSILGATWGGN